MTARLRLWWQYIRKHWIVAIIVVFVVLVALIFVGYWFNWTGFNGYNKVTTTTETTSSPPKITRTEEYQPGKSLWDWLQLLGILAIPAVVGLGAAWYAAQQGKASDRENTDNQREAALQGYIDKMSDLLLKEHLRESVPDLRQILQIRSGNSQIHLKLKPEYEEVRKIARVRTLTVLSRLDPARKRSTLLFLYESGLIDKDKHIIDLHAVDLHGADLSGADLSGADLSGAILEGANLSDADLSHTNLSGAFLNKANLFDTDLSGADLSDAHLSGAFLSDAHLSHADLRGASLGGTNLSDADLSHTDLSGAFLNNANLFDTDLSGADLSGADLSDAKAANGQLDAAKSLKGATMPDGSKHP